MSENTITKLDDVIDFDLLELEELEEFQIPPAGVYNFEGVEIYNEQDSEPAPGKDAPQLRIVCKLSLTELLESHAPEKSAKYTLPKEITIKAPLNNLDGSYVQRAQQNSVRKVTVAVGDALKLANPEGKISAKLVAEKFQGTVGAIEISNRTYTDKTTRDLKEAWAIKDIVVS